MAELAALAVKRSHIKGRLTRVANALREFKDGDNIYQLKTRIPYLEGLQKEFDEVQLEIELLDPEASKKDDQAVFEDVYFNTLSQIQLIVENAEKRTSSASGSVASRSINDSFNSQLHIKLPTLNLPNFSGSYSEWSSFYDTFNSLIHLNDKLNDCERFHYLKSCLKNEPLHAVESLPVSDANYASAWEILKKRYENKRLIVQEHVLNIIKLPVIIKSSHASLRPLLDKLTSNLAALRVLQLPIDSWDALIVPIVTEKLDYVTKKEWQETLGLEIPKFSELKDFLEKRLIILSSFDTTFKPQQANKGWHIPNKSNYQVHVPRQASYISANKPHCFQCNRSSHNIYQCVEFLKLSVPERLNQVSKYKLCRSCLRANHSTSECRSNKNCQECNQKHNSLLHQNQNIKVSPNTSEQLNSGQPSASEVVNHCAYKLGNTVLLSTALVYIKDGEGKFQECRALLDVGSQSCFLSKSMCQNLKLQTKGVNIPITGISQKSSTVTQAVTVTIKSRYNAFSATLECLILPKITENLPIQTFNISYVEIPPNIKLADPNFNQSGQVDLLIGAELFWKLLCVGQIQTAKTQPSFHKTHLGWIMGGSINVHDSLPVSCNLAINNLSLSRLDDGLTKFWELEHSPVERTSTLEECKCQTHFKETHQRDVDGRFIIKLPLKNDYINVGSSYEIAVRRFYNLEKKLNNNLDLKQQYSKFINEYRDLNHMELVPQRDLDAPSCYLPHHAVFKESSSTTKLRVVFDASSKTSNGLSLNDNLMCGPVLQQDLFRILMRFRTFQYVLNGDITKMYRQIKIHSTQADYQRILWRDNPEEPIQIFRLSTLTYGTKPASFIATRCLQELAQHNQQEYPLSSKVISRDFYMDDLLTGADSLQEAINLRDEIVSILAQGGFELRKFSSNHPEILPIESGTNSDTIINLDKNGNTKTLGLLWNCTQDLLKFEMKTENMSSKVTKRSILSAVAQIFDPLGLIGPVTIRAKIIMQQLWSLKLGWDESVPMTVHSLWIQFFSELSYLNDLQIERKVVSLFPTHVIELHGFCDASQQGYGAAIYIRCTDIHNNHSSQLLCAKSRVAPLKTVTIPRLELCAALLLAKLFHNVNQTLNLNINKHFLWTDSTIVLAWLASTSTTLNTFVANRISEIQSLTPIDNWHHIRSEDNPADIISRGLLPRDLIKSELWFHGPSWLRKNASERPHSIPKINEVELIENRRVILLSNKLLVTELPMITKYSRFSKLQRIMAFCLRFIHNSIDKVDRLSGDLSPNELQNATRTILRIVQSHEFPVEINKLKNGKPLDKNSKVISLDPFLDEHGLIRVGGRLRNSSISNDKKYPIILPKGHHVTKLIILLIHERQLHAGAQATLASLRENYWIISARSIIRQMIHKCIKCFRARPRAVIQKMGDLPKNRLELSRPFLNSGVDYAGPISIKEGRGRGKRSVKAYIALFVCFSTKAIHLELVGDLTTEAFLNALKRFIARRGHITQLFSDNATNFVGAKRELDELARLFENSKFQGNLNDALAPLNIKWQFIPPRSPNMGGLWEINIKAVKFHIKRVLGDALLNYEEMYTLLTRIEACLNSRPLTPLTSDPNDLVALTPGHFLIGESLTATVEHDVTEIKVNRLSRWQRIEQLRQHFWKRWHREYLVQMQQRAKWRQEAQHRLQVGDMVVVIEDNCPPQQWPLGRIVQLHPGADNLTRVVLVKTVRGVFKRAVSRICVLPTNDEQ